MAFLLINPRNSPLACREMLAEPLQMLMPHSSEFNCKYSKLCLDSIKGSVSSRTLVQCPACLQPGLVGPPLAHAGQNELMFIAHFLRLPPRQPTPLSPSSASLSLSHGTQQGWWEEQIMKVRIPAFLALIFTPSYGSSWWQWEKMAPGAGPGAQEPPGSSPAAAVTNHQDLGGLKWQKCLLSQVWGPEV